MARSNVDFPHAEGPTTSTISPWSTDNEHDRSTGVPSAPP